LVLPGRNQSKKEDGIVDQYLPVIKGLFFDYELDQDGFLSRRGDKRYKTANHFGRYIDTEEVEKIKSTLSDTTVQLREIL
ncbi:MAG: hypothetical protein AAGG75_23715, partial [Bacteroidota bacterium]